MSFQSFDLVPVRPSISIISCDDALRDSVSFRLRQFGYETHTFGCSAVSDPPEQMDESGVLILGEDAFLKRGGEAFDQSKFAEHEQPVLLLTSCVTRPLIQRAMKIGIHGVFEMPFLDHLWQRLDELASVDVLNDGTK